MADWKERMKMVALAVLILVLSLPIFFYIFSPMIHFETSGGLSGLVEHYGIYKQNGAGFLNVQPSTRANANHEWREHGFPNIVHVYWCQTKSDVDSSSPSSSSFFTYVNYLSIRTVLAVLNPQLVYFCYKRSQQGFKNLDQLKYNTWFEDLEQSMFNLLPVKFGGRSDFCKRNRSVIEGNDTGIYLDANVIVTPHVISLVMANSQTHNFSIHCSELNIFPSQESMPPCIYMSEQQQVYPVDFYHSDSALARFIRRALLGASAKPIPVASPGSLVPLICHYVWLGGGRVEYLLYLSILSCINVLR